MDQQTFQQTLHQLRDLLEEVLITESDYVQQKADVLAHLREACTHKRCTPKEALQALKTSHVSGDLSDAEYDRERKWFLQAMLPSAPSAKPVASAPSGVSLASATPRPHGADIWATGGGVSSGSPHAVVSSSHGADIWATGMASPAAFSPTPTSAPAPWATPAPVSSASKTAEDSLVGRVLFERFRVERFAGAGGMGRVYQCYDQHKEAYYALKLLPPVFAEDASARQRMLQEIRINELLHHKGIVRSYDLFHLPSVGAFFTMEWLEGQTFEQILNEARQHNQKPALPLPQLAELFRGIGDALEHAHHQGVIHRDLKPANLMILSGQQVKVMDFGIAKIVDTHTTHHTGMTGTLFYMAPEQMRGAARVTPAADVYSLAVVLYEALTLELPVGRVTPPSRLCGELPVEADEILLKAIERDPEDRFPSVSAFLQAMLPWMRQTADDHQFEVLYEEVIQRKAQERKEALTKALPLLQQRASSDPRAMFLLGSCLMEGWGIAQDDIQAVAWFRKSAERGFADAQCNLGWMYANSRGVTQNDEQAVAWYTKAAEQGHADAVEALSRLKKRLMRKKLF